MAAGIGGVRNLVQRQKIADRVLFSELGARSVGLIQGVKEGLRQAGRTARTGEGSDFANKVEARTQDAISGVKGTIIRTPTRMLSAADELYKAMARRMELSGLAVRQAAAEGLKGEEGRKRIAELLANPTDEMLEKAFDYGRYITFQRPLSGAMQGLSRFTQQMPGMKFILPFVRTPTNLLKFSLERSPAAPLIDTWRADFKAGGARRDLAVARALVGTGVGALIMEMAAKGDITGNGPADEKAKQLMMADGWQLYSIRVGNKYYSYSRLDPFATTLGVAAGMADLQDHMTERQKDEVALLLTASIMQNLSSKTWLSGIGDMVQAVDDPARYADNWWQRFAGSAVVPAGVAQIARSVDPTLREADSTLDAIRARVPGISNTLEPKRDVWGQPITREGGVGPDLLSPAYVSRAKDDAVTKVLLDANIHVSKPQRKWQGRDLNLQDYGSYQELAGALGKGAVQALVSSPEWKDMDQEERQDAVNETMRHARKQARDNLPKIFGSSSAGR